MDAVKNLRGRNGATTPAGIPKRAKLPTCGYCRAVLIVDPKFPHKKFCNDTHRKLFHRYGSLSIGKIAERTIRDARKMIEAEVAPLRARVEALERAAEQNGLEHTA